jgi:hypothetical protein
MAESVDVGEDSDRALNPDEMKTVSAASDGCLMIQAARSG